MILNIIEQMGLQVRSDQTVGGLFRYSSPWEDSMLEFQWDGAGIDASGDIVLFEHEGSIVNMHIQGHLSRLAIMLAKGERVRKLVWITDEDEFSQLRQIVQSWNHCFFPLVGFESPVMEYRSLEGNLLAIDSMDGGRV